MAKNYIARGDIRTVIAAGAVVSGGVYNESGTERIGVYQSDAALGEAVETSFAGAYELPASNVEAFVVGQLVNWDGAQLVSGAGTRAGTIYRAKATAEALAVVVLE